LSPRRNQLGADKRPINFRRAICLRTSSHSRRKPTGARSREARRRILAFAKQKRVP
jgi:hypothetical protein